MSITQAATIRPDAVILSGGTADLVGGEKVLAPLGGRPMLEHVIERLVPQVARIALSTNGDASRLADTGLPVLTDEDPEQGPLGGVLAAMHWARGSHVLIVPGDAPFLPGDLVARLGAHDFALASSPSGLHSTFGLWPKALASAVREALFEGRRQLPNVAQFYSAKIVEFPDDAPFFNVNTPADLAEAEAMLSRTSR